MRCHVSEKEFTEFKEYTESLLLSAFVNCKRRFVKFYLNFVYNQVIDEFSMVCNQADPLLGVTIPDGDNEITYCQKEFVDYGLFIWKYHGKWVSHFENLAKRAYDFYHGSFVQ